jgi:hypothetical protein
MALLEPLVGILAFADRNPLTVYPVTDEEARCQVGDELATGIQRLAMVVPVSDTATVLTISEPVPAPLLSITTPPVPLLVSVLLTVRKLPAPIVSDAPLLIVRFAIVAGVAELWLVKVKPPLPITQ